MDDTYSENLVKNDIYESIPSSALSFLLHLFSIKTSGKHISQILPSSKSDEIN
jgi:hypothetical protein